MKEVIIALDFPTIEDVKIFLDKFGDEKLFVKVGMELYLQNGPKVIEMISNMGHKIFLDLKLHDIPNTVYGAIKGLSKFNVDFITIHASGGKEMMRYAKKALKDTNNTNTKLLAITQLTSTTKDMLNNEQNINGEIIDSVIRYAKNAKESCVDGVVSSVWETQEIKKHLGSDFLVVNPGIRLPEESHGDQKRVASPSEANKLGADYIVVGRSITASENPFEKYVKISRMFRGEINEK